MNTNPAPKRFYRSELDALRFCAFLMVFVTHAMPNQVSFYTDHLHLPAAIAQLASDIARAGRGGVVLFFMLSSYLITALLLREHAKTGTLNLLAFYQRRALRIWPLYFTFLAGCIIVPYFTAYAKIPLPDVIGFCTFTENWRIVHTGYDPNTVAIPLWSVSVEEQFYLLWPLLILLVGVSRIWLVAGLCILGAFVSRGVMASAGANETQFWQSSLSHIDSIAIGALIAYFAQNGIPKTRAVHRLLMISLGVIIPVYARGHCAEVIRYPLVTLSSALILAGVMGYDLPDSKLSRCVVYLGKISFGLYVYHTLFIWGFDSILPKVLFVAPAAFLCTIAVATFSYAWIEMPFLRMKEKLAVVDSRPVSVTAPAGSAVADTAPASRARRRTPRPARF